MEKIVVRFEFNYEFDAQNIPPHYTDAVGFAKKEALSELIDALKYGYLDEDDFEVTYVD